MGQLKVWTRSCPKPAEGQKKLHKGRGWNGTDVSLIKHRLHFFHQKMCHSWNLAKWILSTSLLQPVFLLPTGTMERWHCSEINPRHGFVILSDWVLLSHSWNCSGGLQALWSCNGQGEGRGIKAHLPLAIPFQGFLLPGASEIHSWKVLNGKNKSPERVVILGVMKNSAYYLISCRESKARKCLNWEQSWCDNWVPENGTNGKSSAHHTWSYLSDWGR